MPLLSFSFHFFPDRLLSHLRATRTNRERKSLSRPRVLRRNSPRQRNQFRRHYAANLFPVLLDVILIPRPSLTVEASVIAKPSPSLSLSLCLVGRKNSFVNIRRGFLICASVHVSRSSPIPPRRLLSYRFFFLSWYQLG